MRVLFLDSSSVWSAGARAFHAAGMALATRGYDVAFACPPGSVLERRVRKAALAVYPVSRDRSPWQQARPVREALESHFADVVFAQEPGTHLAAAVAARRAAHGAVVRRIPAGEVFPSDRRTRWADRFAPAAYLVTAPTGGAQEPPTVPTIHAPLGIDPPAVIRAAGGDDGLHLACVASDADLPNAAEVLRAFALLAERHPRCRLTITGMGERLDECRILAAAVGVAKTVRWVSDAGNGADPLAGAAAAWVVASGDAGAFGCLDAMARGVPILAPRTPVTERYLDGERDPARFVALQAPEMAAAVEQLLARREMGAPRGDERGGLPDELREHGMANAFEQAARMAHARERKRS
jgi:glycosyltransferase involved in cell wall biosynthesis